MNAHATLFATLVLLVSFESGLCTSNKCYQCASTNNPGCKDPFASKSVPNYDCSSNEVVNFYNTYLNNILPATHTQNAPKYCLKMTLAGSLGDQIIRACVEGPSNNMNKTCQELERSGAYGQFVATKQSLKHCSVCDGDLCNGAHTATASVGIASAIAAVVAYLAY